MKMIVTVISTDLVTNSTDLATNQKQESGVQQVGDLGTRNNSVFCLQRVALFYKATPNSIDFHKGIFLHVIPARIIAPCFHLSPLLPYPTNTIKRPHTPLEIITMFIRRFVS